MKVALLTNDSFALHYSALVSAVRLEIGSVELIILTPRQQNDLKDFMSKRRWNERYDRIVLNLDPKKLYEQRQAFRHYHNLCMLRVNYDSERQNIYSRQLVESIPWIRWIGSNPEVVRQLSDAGFDANLIKPVYEPNQYRLNKNPRELPECFIHDEFATLTNHADFNAVKDDIIVINDSETVLPKYQNIQPMDFFIFWPRSDYYNPLPMIKAMAVGAVVLTLDPGEALRQYYGWEDNENCVFVRDQETIVETLRILMNCRDLAESISQAAKKTVEPFKQLEVGRYIGTRLDMPMRERQDYKDRRIKLFGLRI